MQIKYMVAALCCASLMAGFAACGGDDDDNDNGASGPCEQFCPVAVDLACPGYDDLDTCAPTCNALLSQLPSDCQDELDAFVSCMEGASDVECGTVMPLQADSCSAESNDVLGCVMGGTGGTGNNGGSGNESGSPAAEAGAGGAN